MPIQLRHSTQQQNLPSAASHGVGLPISDGGMGAVSRALGQVAGAAGNIGARLQQKKDKLNSENSSSTLKSWDADVTETKAAMDSARIKGDIESYKTAKRRFDTLNPNNPAFDVSPYIPAQGKGGASKVSDIDLTLFQENAASRYAEFSASDQVAQARNTVALQEEKKQEAKTVESAEAANLASIVRQDLATRYGELSSALTSGDLNLAAQISESLNEFRYFDLNQVTSEGGVAISKEAQAPHQNSINEWITNTQIKAGQDIQAVRTTNARVANVEGANAPVTEYFNNTVRTPENFIRTLSQLQGSIDAARGEPIYSSGSQEIQDLLNKGFAKGLENMINDLGPVLRDASSDDITKIINITKQAIASDPSLDNQKAQELFAKVAQAEKTATTPVAYNLKVDRSLGAVQSAVMTLVNTETSSLDRNVIANERTRIVNNIDFGGEQQTYQLKSYDHALTEFDRLQDPEHGAEYMKMLIAKLNGENVWTGDPEAFEGARNMFEKRFEKMAKKYKEAQTSEDKWLVVSPDLERQKIELFSKYPRKEALAKWRIATEDIMKAIGPEALFPDPVLPSQERTMLLNPHKLGVEPFDVEVSGNFVIDGDSFAVGNTQEEREDPMNQIRLAGVDTPEYGSAEYPVSEEERTLAAASTAYAKELIEQSGTVTVVPMGTGHHGRLIADVILRDGTSLSKRIIHDRMGLDNPNFGKKQIHTTHDHGYNPSEVAALRQAAHESGYVSSKVAPGGEDEAARLFERDKSGKKFVLSEREIIAGAYSFYSDLVGGGYDASLTGDTYMGSLDPAIQSLGAVLKILDSTHDGMDNIVLGALVVDPIPEGTTSRNLVDKAIGFLNEEGSGGGLRYNKTQSVINAMRTSGDSPMANMLEGLQERTVHWLLQNRPQDYEGKSPEVLAADADAVVAKIYTPIRFSKVSAMHDVYVSTKALNSAGISDKFLSRFFNKDTVTQEQFAETLFNHVVEVFTADFGDSVAGMYAYPQSMIDNPDIPPSLRNMYISVNNGLRKFFKEGDAGELERLMDDGHVVLSFDARNPETGEQVVVYKVRQENGTWRQSPYQVPLSVFYDVFSNPAEATKAFNDRKSLEGWDEAMLGLGLGLETSSYYN